MGGRFTIQGHRNVNKSADATASPPLMPVTHERKEVKGHDLRKAHLRPYTKECLCEI